LASYFSEDEQFEQLKAWWKRNGIALIAGVLLGVSFVVGNNLWKKYRAEQAETASALYEQMMIGYTQKQVDTAQAAGGKLMQDYTSTPYAGKAALYMARISFETADMRSARAQLQWAIDNATEPATVHTARLRLARIMEDSGELDQALQLIDVSDTGGFGSEYEEARGDLLVAKGEVAEARSAYQRALNKLPPGSTYGKILQIKLADLGGG